MSTTVKLLSIKLNQEDSTDRDETEAYFRFSLNDDKGELFVASDILPVKALEKALRGMLSQYGLLPQELEDSLFDFAQLGVVSDPTDPKQQTHIVKLFRENPKGQLPVELANTLDNKCPNRAAIMALCQLYSKVCNVTFDLFWAERKPQQQAAQVDI